MALEAGFFVGGFDLLSDDIVKVGLVIKAEGVKKALAVLVGRHSGGLIKNWSWLDEVECCLCVIVGKRFGLV